MSVVNGFYVPKPSEVAAIAANKDTRDRIEKMRSIQATAGRLATVRGKGYHGPLTRADLAKQVKQS